VGKIPKRENLPKQFSAKASKNFYIIYSGRAINFFLLKGIKFLLALAENCFGKFSLFGILPTL